MDVAQVVEAWIQQLRVTTLDRRGTIAHTSTGFGFLTKLVLPPVEASLTVQACLKLMAQQPIETGLDASLTKAIQDNLIDRLRPAKKAERLTALALDGRPGAGTKCGLPRSRVWTSAHACG
jgi:hypothetical protein